MTRGRSHHTDRDIVRHVVIELMDEAALSMKIALRMHAISAEGHTNLTIRNGMDRGCRSGPAQI